MKTRLFHIVLLLILAVSSFSCSTTRVLEDGQYRLTKNDIEVTNDKTFKTKKIQSYIRQRPDPWNPLLCVYNWGKNGEKGLGKIFRKIGQAPVVYSPDMLNSSAVNIEERLKYLGYYDSKVDAGIEVHKKKVRARYVVTLGKQFPIKDLSFLLPERGDIAEDFLGDTSSIMIHRGDFLSEELLEKEAERSAAYLRQLGYYGFSKNYYSFEADTLSFPGEAVLEEAVREYTRNETSNEAMPLLKSQFRNISINYPSNFSIKENVLKNMNTIHPGDIYSESAVTNTYNRLSSIRSFSNVSVSLTKVDSTNVDCEISLYPAKQQGFKLNLEGSSNSTGLLGISPELSFFHRNVFHGGELLNLSFMGNFQFKPNQHVKSTEYGVSAGISLPRFVGLPIRVFKGQIPRTDIKTSYNYQDRPEYTRSIISASYGYSGYAGNFSFQFFPLQLNIVKLYNIQEDFYKKLVTNPFMLNSFQNHFDLGLGTTLYYTTNSDVNPKTSYQYARLTFGLAGNLLSAFKGIMKKDANGAAMIWNTPYSQYVRSELTLGKTWRFGKDEEMGLATRLLVGAGYAYGNSSVLPFEQHFYAGGANSLRGWQSRSVGPGLSKPEATFIIPNQSGDMKLETNIEFRFPMFWKLQGATFVDAGNIWLLQESNSSENSSLGRLKASTFLESIAADWGLGLRLDLNIILVRFDLGMQFHDPAMDEGERWISPSQWLKRDNFGFHFGVGYPF
ncbi:MAG: BamA/TamA family outer membrane protein [Bacteroidales bacterium]|nr:BamA/TamA family outer membrane protein [Bacteroidales bacterium]